MFLDYVVNEVLGDSRTTVTVELCLSEKHACRMYNDLHNYLEAMTVVLIRIDTV